MVLKIFGWLFATLSLINLIVDFNIVILYGKIKIWIEAYGMFVDKITSFLFGWLDFYWINISKLEAHILILTLIFSSAIMRAGYHISRYGKLKLPISEALSSKFNDAIEVFLFVFIPILLLPDIYGLYVGSFVLGLAVLGLFMDDKEVEENTPIEEKTQVTASDIRKEILEVLAMTVFLILINYFLASKKVNAFVMIDRYSVQYMALKNKYQANLISDNLKEKGFSSFIEYNGIYYIVRVGKFSTNEEALNELKKIRNFFPKNGKEAYIKILH